MNKKKLKYVLVFLILIALIIIPMTYSKYIKKYTKQLTVNAIQPTYQVVFMPNGGEGTMPPQTLTYKTPAHLDPNEFTNGSYAFEKWNTKADGSGQSYEDGQEVNNLTTENGGIITLYAQWVDKAARIGDTYYDTLEEAVDAVFPTHPQTTIILLKNVDENIIVPEGVDIILDLNHKTLNSVGNNNAIKNNGTLEIRNGNIHNNAKTNGAVNNYQTGTIVIDGVTITVDGNGNRQAFWNDRGVATIKGGSVLTSVAVDRPAVTNVAGGTMTILDATIESTGAQGLINGGTLTLGSNDTEVIDNPVIIGKTIGLQATANVNYYDGIFKGRNSAVNDENKLINSPLGYSIASGIEVIDGNTYLTKHLELGVTFTVTFDGNGGTTPEVHRSVTSGTAIGTLPVATLDKHDFDGWFDDPTGGNPIDENTIITGDVTYYAHFTRYYISEMNGTKYDSIQDAIDAAPNNTNTTITLLRDTEEKLIINPDKDITLDFNTHTLNDLPTTNVQGNNVIVNNGTLTITNGTIHTDANQGAINQEAGVLNVIDMTIVATGDRQTIYATGGVTNISGNTHLESNTTGIATGLTMQRGTVQCGAGATVNITGGTIIAHNTIALTNEGTVNIGTKDGTIDATNPIFQGKTYGIKSRGTLNIYDGIIKGQTATIDGTVSDIENNSHWVNTTETIDLYTYAVDYLELD